jgi:soluble lytic murein transglycosylase-like protein
VLSAAGDNPQSAIRNPQSAIEVSAIRNREKAMSIESINARISEIQARIDALTVRPEIPTPQAPAAVAAASPGGAQVPASVEPFNVSLAQAQGNAFLRPTSGDEGKFSPYIEGLITKYSAQNNLDPKLVRAVITAESDGDVQCRSSKGAMGLMQLMPDEVTAYGIKNPFDPEENIRGGTRQLAEKLKLYNGDVSLALAAYNAGTGAVRKYNGIPPYPETQGYVKKILAMVGQPH